MTANQLGLFVFSVRVEEYRAGKRIGYALRDFQLKVVDCPINNAPVSFAKLKGSSSRLGKDEIITIPNSQKNACFELFFTDPNPYTQIKLKVVGGLLMVTSRKTRSIFDAIICIWWDKLTDFRTI